jgi:hypothetical protein
MGSGVDSVNLVFFAAMHDSSPRLEWAGGNVCSVIRLFRKFICGLCRPHVFVQLVQ